MFAPEQINRVRNCPCMEVMMKYLDVLNDFLNKILIILGGIAVMALMLLATGNVVLRILSMPYKGTYEIVSFLGAVVIAELHSR